MEQALFIKGGPSIVYFPCTPKKKKEKKGRKNKGRSCKMERCRGRTSRELTEHRQNANLPFLSHLFHHVEVVTQCRLCHDSSVLHNTPQYTGPTQTLYYTTPNVLKTPASVSPGYHLDLSIASSSYQPENHAVKHLVVSTVTAAQMNDPGIELISPKHLAGIIPDVTRIDSASR